MADSASPQSLPGRPQAGRTASGRTHPGLTISVAAGIIGAVLLLTGVLLDSDGVLFSGVFLGAISLLAALVWRADLVASWRSGNRSG